MATFPISDIKSYWKNLSDAVSTLGSAITGKGITIAGTDGTNARAIKTNSSGEILAQLSGSNEQKVYYNALAITDTYQHDVAIDLSNYITGTFYLHSTLDQEIRVSPVGLTLSALDRAYFYYIDSAWHNLTDTETINIASGGGGRVYVLNSYMPFLNKAFKNLKLRIKATVAPTSGSITIWYEGVHR